MRAHVLAALFCVVLACHAAAATPISGTLEARSVQSDGQGALAGRLVVLLEQDTTGAVLSPPGFLLSASQAVVETVVRDPTVSGDLPANGGTNPATGTTTHHDVIVEGTVNRAGYRWNVFPDGLSDVTISDCIALAPSRDGQITWEPRVANGDSGRVRTADARGALAAAPCAGQGIDIRGNFTLTFWEWDARLSSVEGRQNIESGASPSRVAAPVPSALAQRYTEVYVKVHGGILHVPNPGAAPLSLDVAATGARQHAQGAIRFVDVHGTLLLDGVQQEIRDGALNVAGDLSLAFRVGGPSLQFDATGTISQADDPRLLGAAAVPGPAPQAIWWMVGPVLVIALLAVAVHRYPTWYYGHMASQDVFAQCRVPENARERRGLGYWALARHLVQTDRPRLALWLARRGGRVAPRMLELATLQAFILYLFARWKEARSLLEGIHEGLMPGAERALNAIELADVNLRIGDRRQARRWLRAARAEDWEVCQREMGRPVFRALGEQGSSPGDPSFT